MKPSTALAKAIGNAKSLAEAGARASGRNLSGMISLQISDSGEGMSAREQYYQRRRNDTVQAPGNGLLSLTPDGLEVVMTLKVEFGLK